MSLRIAITGATGLVGSQLIPYFQKSGHQVTQITRQPALKGGASSITWDPDAGKLDESRLEGHDVVIHLAGTNVGSRWTETRRQSILDSRVNGTRLLCATLAELKYKPKVLLSASAIGFYGNHAADRILDEHAPKGKGFLSDVCEAWERETQIASKAGIRVVNMRFGVVLSKRGGALAKMNVPFQLGLGGVLGSGHQMMSWIALDEIPSIMMHLINVTTLNGPVNVVSPQAMSNKDFTKTLGQVIKRPTIFPVPALGIKALFGEMGQEMLLEGSRVYPERLVMSNYQFKYPDLKSALEKAME
jgi:uncharacterized protein